MFLTDDAVDLFGIGEAMIFIEGGDPDDALLLFFNDEVRDGACRAHLPAEVAVVFAISQPGNKDGHEDPVDACPEIIRVECAAEADLYALAAPDTFFEKILFVADPRWPEESFILRR